MKRFWMFAMLLSLGVFATGCGQKESEKKADGEAVIVEETVIATESPDAKSPEKPASDAK